MNILNSLKGNRTYLTVAVAILYLIGAKLGYWTLDEKILGIIGATAIGFLRAGMPKLSNVTELKGELLTTETERSQGTQAQNRLLGRDPRAGLAIVLIGLVGLIGPGCASMSGERTGRALAQSAIYFGTVKHLRAHPEDRPIFEATKASLEALVVQTNWSAAALAAAFQQLPINGLEGPDSDLYVSTFLVLWDGAVQDSVRVETPEQVREMVAPLLIGLRLGLAAAPTEGHPPAARGFNYRGNWATRYAYRTY